ncbi:hypothetical protein OWR28_15750 [Chryseobacterium sp. 1B4]
MKLYAEENNFSEAEKLANAVIANSKNSAAVIETAKVIKARSLMNSGKIKMHRLPILLLKNHPILQ